MDMAGLEKELREALVGEEKVELDELQRRAVMECIITSTM